MKKYFFYGTVRKIIILIADFVFNNLLALAIIGFLNKRFKLIASIFVDYPVSDFYADYYSFGFFRKKVMNWTRPILSGLIIFKGKLIIKFSTAKTPVDFNLPENSGNLRNFYEAIQKIKDCLNASEATFAGILPGVLFRHRLLKDRNSSIVTACLVCNAIEKIFSEKGLPKCRPIIGLGGAGFVGRAVTEEMRKRGYVFFVVDLKENSGQWPSDLNGKPIVVLNLLSDNKGLIHYLKYLSNGSILINEAYPPPEKSFTATAKEKGVDCFHVCGAKADLVIPNFPGYYQNNQESRSIPCCATPFALIKQGVKPVLRSI